jgi:hypothetical protein
LILRCKTAEQDVVEERVTHDAEEVYVRRRHLRLSTLLSPRSLHLQLNNMGLVELPSELLRMKNLKTLWLHANNLCSLPSEIAHLETLEFLFVRRSKRFDRHLTTRLVLGREQQAQVSSARARSTDQSQAT